MNKLATTIPKAVRTHIRIIAEVVRTSPVGRRDKKNSLKSRAKDFTTLLQIDSCVYLKCILALLNSVSLIQA